MVAATKMRKSQEVALRARPFAREALSLLRDLVLHEEVRERGSVFFNEVPEGKVCLVVATSDKGLAGSFNAQVLRLASQWLQENKGADVVAVGRKGRDFFRGRGIAPAAEFFQFSDIATLHDVAPLSEWIIRAFELREYRRVVVVSTHFISALVQKPGVRQVLPLTMEDLQKAVEEITPTTGRYSEPAGDGDGEEETAHLLEPAPQAILETLVRDLVEVEILHYVFESNASEHSARMVAMKNATENASGIQEELELELNKARQAAITQELTEIATAKEALTTE